MRDLGAAYGEERLPRYTSYPQPTLCLFYRCHQRAGAFMDLLRKVAAERRAAVIVVTHDEKIFDRFDHIDLIRDGRLEQSSRPDESVSRWLGVPIWASGTTIDAECRNDTPDPV